MTLPAIVPLLSATPGATLWAGPALGEHTDEVCGDGKVPLAGPDLQRMHRHSLRHRPAVQVLREELGMSAADIQRLRDLEAI